MQEPNEVKSLRQTTPQNIEGSFGKLPPDLLKRASDLMDRAIAQSRYREAMSEIIPQVLGVPPRD